MTFSILIPSWRGVKLLAENLPVVLKVGADEVIVVDDASEEHDAEFVSRNFPEVRVYRNKRNLGFGSTVNWGVKQAKGDIVVLLNQDVNPEKDILQFIEQDFVDKSVFGVSLSEEQFGPSTGCFRDGYIAHEPVRERPKKVTRTFWVSGGSGAFRKKYWEQLGGFDPIYDPGYWEDVDLCYRAAKHGWQLLWDPFAKVKHEHESSFGSSHFDQGRKRRIQERNQLLMTWRNLDDPVMKKKHYFNLLKRLLTHPGYMQILVMAGFRYLKLKPDFIDLELKLTDRELLHISFI